LLRRSNCCDSTWTSSLLWGFRVPPQTARTALVPERQLVRLSLPHCKYCANRCTSAFVAWLKPLTQCVRTERLLNSSTFRTLASASEGDDSRRVSITHLDMESLYESRRNRFRAESQRPEPVPVCSMRHEAGDRCAILRQARDAPPPEDERRHTNMSVWRRFPLARQG
jgi:hypothetical protein